MYGEHFTDLWEGSINMNNRERVNAVIAGSDYDICPSQVDFTPAQIETLCHAKDMTEDQLMIYSGNCIKYVNSLGNVEEYFNKDVHDDAMKQFALDCGFARIDEEKQLVYDVFGVGWNLNSEGVSADYHPLENLDEYSQYHWPVPTDNRMMRYGQKTVEKYRDQYYLLGFQHIGLFERSWCLRGYENFMCDIMLEPDFVEEILDHILAYKLAEAKMYIELGVDAVRLGDDWGLQKGLQIRPELWREFIKPRQEKLYAFYREAGLPTFQHSCGDIMDIIPDLIEIGLDVLHPIQPLSMDINSLSERFGDKLVLWGGIDTQEVLPFYTAQAITDEVKRVFKILGKNKKYIIAPSQEVMSDVPLENVIALIDGINACKM